MANLSLAAPAKEHAAHPVDAAQPTLLVASFGSTVAADFAARVTGCRPVLVELGQSAVPDAASACVLFVDAVIAGKDRLALDALLPRLRDMKFVGIVSSFRAHFGDVAAAETEAIVLRSLKGSAARVVVIRPGHVLSAGSRPERLLRRFGGLYPLVPSRLRSCFLDGDELFAAVAQEWRSEPRTSLPRTVTILGSNRAYRDVLRAHVGTGLAQSIVIGICFALSLLLVGHLAALLLQCVLRWRPALRRWNFDTLQPRSFAELLALCNRYNLRHVKIVGYNNGVHHFGHRYPDKTVVSTVHCRRVRRVSDNVIKADCGATICQASDFLASADQELFVLPNFSYVCLGTAFFVPIHGSASDFTTVAETVTKVLLFDPVDGRFILATSEEAAFRETIYDLKSNLVVLRLWLKVKARARYFIQQQTCANPDSGMLLEALRDAKSANVEIRKAKASSSSATISKYYNAIDDSSSDVLEVPRDQLGRLWDRLEENWLTALLMHWFARTLIWHVELFFTAEEFAVFWRTHGTLPLRKIQLRYIRRDGLPHSPFCAHDCVSVDLFVMRWNRAAFEAYLKKTFAVVRTNPGKHTQ